jgi:peptidyl-prolyl cis-trans isomerase B (cyclophilin B)
MQPSKLLLASLSLLLIGAGCQAPQTVTESYSSNSTIGTVEISEPTPSPALTLDQDQIMKTATLVTSKGTITFELFPETAPKAVENFKTLADQNFYAGIKVHRRIEDFMVQIGDPQTKTLPLTDPRIGSGGPGYRFEDELTDDHEYNRGILAMANAGPDTNGSQIFIMLADYPLPKLYTIFGRVTAGQDVVDNFVIGDEIISLTVTE